jgi:polo-like kinase 1
LQKKVTLLHHFRNYLLDTKTPTKCESLAESIYVKKWVKSKHAIMFRFSDKTVQVVFTDSTQVILTQQLRVVTYLNKVGERSTMLLSHALESECNEMVKRLKYTKEILSQMLQGPSGSGTKE